MEAWCRISCISVWPRSTRSNPLLAPHHCSLYCLDWYSISVLHVVPGILTLCTLRLLNSTPFCLLSSAGHLIESHLANVCCWRRSGKYLLETILKPLKTWLLSASTWSNYYMRTKHIVSRNVLSSGSYLFILPKCQIQYSVYFEKPTNDTFESN